MPKQQLPVMTLSLARQCRKLVRRVAKEHNVPPVHITAHVRSGAADRARHVVWREMIQTMGFSRRQVAEMFQRDLRRVRKSVIGV